MNKIEWLLDEIQIIGGFVAFCLFGSGMIAFFAWGCLGFSLLTFLTVWLITAIIIGCWTIMDNRKKPSNPSK